MSAKTKVEILVAKLLATSAIKIGAKTLVVSDTKQAGAIKFLGSPSVRADGIDVEPEARDRQEYGMG
jgi:hypothetical protein